MGQQPRGLRKPSPMSHSASSPLAASPKLPCWRRGREHGNRRGFSLRAGLRGFLESRNRDGFAAISVASSLQSWLGRLC